MLTRTLALVRPIVESDDRSHSQRVKLATTRVEGEFSLVLLVYNTIGNLRTQTEQVECFRNAARHLRPGGRFVVEVGVPPMRRLVPGQAAVPFDVVIGSQVAPSML